MSTRITVSFYKKYYYFLHNSHKYKRKVFRQPIKINEITLIYYDEVLYRPNGQISLVEKMIYISFFNNI